MTGKPRNSTGGEAAQGSGTGIGALVGESAAMRRLFRQLRKVAPTEAAVFLYGESGTGKELIARELHARSARAEGPFRAINCGALAEELVESELFGHEKGAFTGADRRHRGVFERADGGTLFLDEVTEMDAEHQVKLLRVLETGRCRRVGGEQEQRVDVRVISATNREPERALEDGSLREDLYYRLAVFPLAVPPLRDRGEDVLRLAEVFLAERGRSGHSSQGLAEATREALMAHDWPGNVRELRNAIIHASILAGEEITPDDLPGNVPGEGALHGETLRIPVAMPLEEVERRVILATLHHFEGDKPRAADALGVSLKTLYNRLKRYEAT